MEKLNREVINAAREFFEEIREQRRFLHKHAERGFALKNTLDFVKLQLKKIGCNPVDCGKAGVIAVIGDLSKEKTILLRADMDALPMVEESDVFYACENGNMHACGHDMHTAMLLGAAKILKKYEKRLPGNVKLMFQPAEEILEGCFDMIQSGLLESPVPDAAMMIHVMVGTEMPVGTVCIPTAGVSAPAADYFTIKIKGKGCHGSMPEKGVDPINVAAHIITAIQEIQTREVGIHENINLTIGTIQAGMAANVIPDTVEMTGSLRTYDECARKKVKERLQEIAKGIGGVFRAQAEVVYGSGCPTFENHADTSVAIRKYMEELLGRSHVYTPEQMCEGKEIRKSSGSEDFSYLTHIIPCTMVSLSAASVTLEKNFPLHHPKVQFDENALFYGSAIYAYSALRWLEENS